MTVFRRLALVILAVLLFIALIFVAFVVFFPRERVARYIENRLAGELSSQAEIYIQSAAYVPFRRFVMRGVVIDNAQTGQQEFAARQVDFYVNPFFIFSEANPVTSIVVRSPEVNLWRTPADKWNVEEIIKQKPKEKEEKKEAEPIAAIGKIFIRNGTVKMFRENGEHMLDIKNIVATIQPGQNRIFLNSAFLSYQVIDTDFQGVISDFSTRPVLDLKTTGHILKNSSDEKMSEPEQVLTFTATEKGTINDLGIDATFSIAEKFTPGIPIEGSLQGTMQSENGTMTVSRLESSIGGSNIVVAGAAKDLWSNHRSVTLSGNAKVLLKQMITAVNESFAKELEPDGTAQGDIALDATMENVKFQGNLNMEQAGLTIPYALRKDIGTPGTFSATGDYAYGAALTIDDFDLTVNGAPIGGSARIDSTREPYAQVSFQTEQFPAAELNRLPVVDFRSGGITASGMVWKAAPDAEGIGYRADATLSKASVLAGPLKEPLKDLDATVKLMEQDLIVQPAQFVFGDSRFQLETEIVDFSTPHINGRLESNELKLPQIVADLRGGEEQGQKGSEEGQGAGKPGNFTLNMLIKANSIYTGQFSTGPLFGTLQSSGEKYTFAPVSLQVFGGEVQASSEFLPVEQAIQWKVDFDGSNINLESFLKQIQSGEPKLTGSLAVKGNLQGSTAGGKDTILRSITGQVQATAKDGKAVKLGILTSIINFTQVPVTSLLIPGLREAVIANTIINLFRTGGRSLDITAVAYTNINGTFQLSDGVAETNELRFNSGIIDLIANGDINYVTDTVDFKVKATPLGALSSVIGGIPIAGKPLKGAKEAVIATNFLVTGPLSAPKVEPALLEEIFGNNK